MNYYVSLGPADPESFVAHAVKLGWEVCNEPSDQPSDIVLRRDGEKMTIYDEGGHVGVDGALPDECRDWFVDEGLAEWVNGGGEPPWMEEV